MPSRRLATMRTVLLLIALSVLMGAVVLRQGGSPPSVAGAGTRPATAVVSAAAPGAATATDGTGRLWSWRSADGVRHLSTTPPPPGTAFVRPPALPPSAAAQDGTTRPVDQALHMATGAAARLLQEHQQALDALRAAPPAR